MINNVFAGIMFNGKHSWRDYGLYLNKPPDFGTPEPKIEYIDIPGRDGVLDYTEAAAGEVKYNNRQMTFTFATEVKRERRERLRSELWNDLHGKTAEIIYDFDSDWYYTGRCSVAFTDVESWKMKVVITVDAQPYKLARDMTIFNVAPTSFAAETIKLGQGTDAMHVNSIFEFGTKSNPQLDLTQFSQLQFRFANIAPYGTPMIQITDSNGVSFNTELTAEGMPEGTYGMDLDVSDITSITKSRVYRILCQNRDHVQLYGVTTASASVMIPVERMTVVPIWTASAAVTAFINGRKYAIPAGANRIYNVRLTEGENQVSFIADSTNTTISIQFTNGRL